MVTNDIMDRLQTPASGYALVLVRKRVQNKFFFVEDIDKAKIFVCDLNMRERRNL